MMPDKVKLKEFIFDQLNFNKIKTVLDLGCGNCDDLVLIKKLHPNKKFNLYGVDRVDNNEIDGLTYLQSDVRKKLPFKDNTFDLVYSHNLLECIKDKKEHLIEIHRVLKNGGTVVCSHMDWDSQLINSDNKELVRKIVKAYAEWKQPWMDEVDPWLGRRLWGIFENSKLFKGELKSYTIINTDFAKNNYGYNMIGSFVNLVKNKLISQGEYDQFFRDLKLSTKKNQYFFSVTCFIYFGKNIKK